MAAKPSLQWGFAVATRQDTAAGQKGLDISRSDWITMSPQNLRDNESSST
jgi:hypothetical protein